MSDLGAALDDDNPDRDLCLHQAALVDRCLVLFEQRAERPLIETALGMRGGRIPAPTWRAQRQWPHEEARAAFLAFSVPPGIRVALPAEIRCFLRLEVSRSRLQMGALSFVVSGDPADWSAYVLLDGRLMIGVAEWRRIRALVERLGAEHGARADIAAVLADRLNRPATRSRDVVNPELIGLAMKGPLAAGTPRVAFPREVSVRAAA